MKKDTVVVGNPASMIKGKEAEDPEIPHAFFTHEGMPEENGMTSLRASALATTVNGKTEGDFAFHLETRLWKGVGMHIRNDRFLNNSHSEIMFQFAVITSKDGKSGFAPIIEFEIPTKKGASRIYSLIGFTTKVTRSRFVFNQVLHYNPREDMVDGSAAVVFKITKSIFFVAEVLGEKSKGESAIINLLAGVKVRLSENIILGVGYQGPVTNNKEFSSQYIFQPEFVYQKGMK